jgi:hypothetical protein
MSPAEPRARGAPARIPRRPNDNFDARAANAAMAEKLRLRSLRRTARTRGLELRHSAHGYSLVDGKRNRVEGRSDLTLDDVARHLEGATAEN